MCGIAGALELGSTEPLTHAQLQSMISTLTHRGPDGFGHYIQGPLALAHARLSIIDLQTGQQPLSNEDGTVWVAFNGEIFNYIELRAELQSRGHRFRTTSDTETIVHAYEEFGDRFVTHLNGQFAIALWDVSRQRLVLARDRVGIRPLYYSSDGQRLLFASEVKALRNGVRKGLQLDPSGVAQVFTFWATVAGTSAFHGIHSLAPGHILAIEDGVERIERYWDWNFGDVDRGRYPDPEAAAEELRGYLTRAIKLQLRADVPVGAYLSGGLDSSVIVALIRQLTSVPMRTFSVTFDDSEFDERPFQDAMVDHLGTSHTSIRCTRLDIGKAFPRLVEHAEVPVLRTAPVPLLILSGAVRAAGFKVVLTGEGADEVFGGYDLFKEAKVRRFWARDPTSPGRAALLTRLYPYLKHSPVGNAAMAASFYKSGLQNLSNPFYAHQPRWDTTRRLLNFLTPAFREAANAEMQCQSLKESCRRISTRGPALAAISTSKLTL